jgi:hypothetical protein
MTSVLHDYSSYKEARSSSRPYINCKVSNINEDYKVAGLNDRPKLFLLFSLSICSIDLIDDGKLGYRFTSADELEEVDIGPGDKPRPTFISKKLKPVSTRADDSFVEGVCRLLRLGLYRDAWVGQEHSRASAPSQEGISAISVASVTNEG